MNQFTLVVRKELRDIITTLKFAVTFGVAAVLILLAFVAGANNYQASVERYEAAKKTGNAQTGRRHRLACRSGPQDLSSAGAAGVAVFRGLQRYRPHHGYPGPGRGRRVRKPVWRGAGACGISDLDLDFVLQIVLSLLGILFAYDAVNGEKESGTLKLSLSGPLTADSSDCREDRGPLACCCHCPSCSRCSSAVRFLPALGMVLSGRRVGRGLP